MRLGFDCNGQNFQMEIQSLGRPSSKDSPCSGLRKVNQILLFEDQFKKFIDALKGDDFAEVKEIFDRVIDTYTKELPYQTGVSNVKIIVDGEPDPYLKQLLG